MTLRNLCQPFVFEFVPPVHQRQNILLHLKHVELPPQVVIVSAIPDAIIWNVKRSNMCMTIIIKNKRGHFPA